MHLLQVLALSFAAFGSLAVAGPCDLYSSGGTPCIAAHSTTRALYSAYSGALYQVKRGSDSTTTTISPLSAGGVANAAAQDTFCANTTCLISIVYDQSGKGNHLTQAPPGGFDGPDVSGYDNLAGAIGAPVTLNGQKAYGVFVSPGTGYRNDVVTGSATGDAAEGMYAVLDGTHYNGACCFDYGNAETSNTDTGDGHMEAIYFGTSTVVRILPNNLLHFCPTSEPRESRREARASKGLKTGLVFHIPKFIPDSYMHVLISKRKVGHWRRQRSLDHG